MFSYPLSPGQKSTEKLSSHKGKFNRKELTSGEKTLKGEQGRLKSIYGKRKQVVKKVQKDPVTGERVIQAKGGIRNMIKTATMRD